MTDHIIGIDVGAETGIAIYQGGIMTTKTVTLHGNDGSARLLHFWHHLHRYHPDVVIFERPFARGAAKRQLDSFVTAIELWAMTNEIRWLGISPSTLKKAITGHGHAKKYEMIAAVNELYPDCPILDDNQADAAGLIHYYLTAGSSSHRDPRRKK